MEISAPTGQRERGSGLQSFWLLIGASLLLPLILFAVIAWRDRQDALTLAEHETTRLTDIFYHHALHVLQIQQLAAERVEDRIRGMTWDEIAGSKAVTIYLQQIRGEYPEVQAIWLADAAGIVRNASQPLPPKPVSVADRDYFRALRDRDSGTFVGRVVQARVMTGLNFNVARRRHDDSGAFDGIVIVTVFSNYFIDFWNSVAPPVDTAVILFRGDGAILARAPGFVSNILTLPADSPVLLAAHTATTGMIRAVSSMTGVDRIYAFRKIDPYDAYLSTGIAADAVFASWRHFLLIYGVLFTTAAAALMTLSLVALGRARKEQRATRHWREAMEQLTREMGLRTAAEARIGHLNEVLSQRAAELELANGELESFSYSVSHDLRAPLRAIDGFSQILLEDYAAKLDTEGQRLLNVVRDSTVKMSRMIDDILAFSRAGRTELATGSVDMSGLVRVAAQDLQAAVAGRKVSFKIGDLPEAHGDSAMLQRVWVNLLDNAVKYTSTRQEAEIEVGSTVGPDEIVYFVRDNGVGFDMEHVGKLFGVFQRLHGAEFPGTGIGLAIVKRIVTRHGGRVWAEGKVNEGATFYFALPKTGGGNG